MKRTLPILLICVLFAACEKPKEEKKKPRTLEEYKQMMQDTGLEWKREGKHEDTIQNMLGN